MKYVRIRFDRLSQGIGDTISFFQRFFLINGNMENVTLLKRKEIIFVRTKINKRKLRNASQVLEKVDSKFESYATNWFKDKIHLNALVTWTPSTVSTKIWSLFLFTRSTVIDSASVFNVPDTSSNGELLASTLRHRLFGTENRIYSNWLIRFRMQKQRSLTCKSYFARTLYTVLC